MHYYSRNIGDYHRKAGRLNILQHGVYNLLIDACYDRESFPTHQEAIDWVWAETDEEIAAVDYVLKKFFTIDDQGRYIQSHIHEDLQEYFAGQEAENTKKGNESERQQRYRERRKEMFALLREHGITPAYNAKMQELQAMCDKLNPVKDDSHFDDKDSVTGVTDDVTSVTGDVTDDVRVTEATAITNNQEPITNKPKNILIDPSESIDTPPSKKSERKSKNTPADFERFYTAYPRKVSKTNAQKAFAKIDLTKHPLETMLTALERYKLTAQWQDKNLIPHPATWLNRQQWLDELDERDMQHNGTMPAGQYAHNQQAGEPETYSSISAQLGNCNPDMYKPAKPFVPEVSNLTPEEQAKAQRHIYELAEKLKGGK